MLAKNLDGVAVVRRQGPREGRPLRRRPARRGSLVLDDGLRTEPLHGLDIVLVDRSAPFGTGALLPRGTLREPPRNLCRASYILLTKCDGTSNEALIEKLRRHNPRRPDHRVPPRSALFGGSLHRRAQALGIPEGQVGRGHQWDRGAEGFEPVWKSSVRGWRSGVTSRITTASRARRSMPSWSAASSATWSWWYHREGRGALPAAKGITVPIYFLRIEVEVLKGHEAGRI